MPRGRIPLRDYAARRIAIIKPSALGDIVHSLPVLTALRRRFPDGHITWIVNRSYEPLLHGHPDLDATLPLDRKAAQAGLWHGAKTYGQFFRECRRQQFDLVIDLQGLLRSGLIAGVSGAERRVGLGGCREGANLFYTDLVPVADFQALHAVERYWLVAEALGAGDGSKEFRLHIPPDAHAWAEKQLEEFPRPWLAVGVGARWVTKRWPPSFFAEMIRRMQSRCGGSAILVGGGDDAELAAATAALVRGPCGDLTGQTSLPRLAAVLSVVDGMLANDTGPLHLAAALGRPVVAPYTCTKVRRNGPYVGEAGAVETRVACGGSYLKRCRRMDCMTDLTPDRLWPALERLIEQWASHSRSA